MNKKQLKQHLTDMGIKVIGNIIRKKDIVAALTDMEINRLPDEAWNLLADWFYHVSWAVVLDGTTADELFDQKILDASEWSDLKTKYATDDDDAIVDKLNSYHSQRTHEIEAILEKKYPQVQHPMDTVLDTYLADKFEKWDQMYSTPGGEPKKKYI